MFRADGGGGEIYEESSATFPPISSSANYFPRLAPCVPVEVVKLPVCPDDLLHSGGRHMVSSLNRDIRDIEYHVSGNCRSS